MIKLEGSLAIRTIHGVRGDFNVGRLTTEIGQFSVKDPLLDQYDEGRYDGTFGISNIGPEHYMAGGRLIVQVKAILEYIALNGVDDLGDDDSDLATVTEPDPAIIEDQKPVTPSAPPEEESEPAKPVSEMDADKALFGLLWPLKDRIRLDSTVGRDKLRQQCSRLKELGYQFQVLEQVWIKSH